ncbi:hypothetical protein SDC9_145459 [bioreactor metagenome]|uniref:Uncharacterized protein n=1 Tax=bioreactor metagenome TaxID=1076179 RepID=A0A645E8G9_9ZZZZ
MPVFNIFSTITSPTFIGALTFIVSSTSIISNIISLGIESCVLTGSKFKYDFSSFTVEVITLLGLVNSSTPYFSPLLQVFPSTLYPSSVLVTTNGHPIGQTIQVIFAIFYASSTLTVISPVISLNKSFPILIFSISDGIM